MTAPVKDVLIVDDNAILREVFAEIFLQLGWRARTAKDGFSALSMIREYVPHLLLSDLNMPYMSGFELLAIVRRRFPQCAVIAMSGAFSGRAVPEGVAADAFYAKGACSASTLLQIVTDLDARGNLEDSRRSVPVWIPAQASHGDTSKVLLVACSNCLRVISFLSESIPPCSRDVLCLHCSKRMTVAVYIEDSPYAPPDRTCELEANLVTPYPLGTGIQPLL